MRVKYTTNELAYSKDGIIYMHPALKKKKWKKLHDRLLDHEKRHLKGGGLLDDFSDIFDFMRKDTYLFMFENPGILKSIFPDTFFDWIMIILIVFTLLVGVYVNPIKILQGCPV